jgi:hypothetical protein
VDYFIILQFSPKRVNNFDLLLHSDGSGKDLEKIVKKIALTAEYTRRISPRPSDDNKIKIMWLDYTRTGESINNGLRIRADKGERRMIPSPSSP